MDLAQTVPTIIERTTEGAWRIAGTRVSLDSVVHAFRQGSTPEEICQDFPALSLAQAYAAVAYYLQYGDAVDAYLAEQDRYDQQTKQELEARYAEVYRELRQRLLERQRTKAA
jgi:uncharacterized protein (DUF433 family)